MDIDNNNLFCLKNVDSRKNTNILARQMVRADK